jgi:hypothetical protein
VTDTYAINLDRDLQDAVDHAQIERAAQAVDACQERDRLMADLRAINEGDSRTVDGPWRDSCALEDPVSREMHTTMLAALTKAIIYPPYLFEAIAPGEERFAVRVESWFNPTVRYAGFLSTLEHLAYTALESLYAPLVIHWTERSSRRKIVRYRDPLTEQIVAPEERLPGVQYAEQLITKIEQEYAGLHFRTPMPWNVYTWPPSAISFREDAEEGATAVVERMWLTREDLLRGRDALFYDPEVVDQLLAGNPPEPSPTARQELEERLGLRDSGNFYECHQILGRIPLVQGPDGRLGIHDDLLDEDVLWLVCGNRVLKRAFGPPVRPYVAFKAFDVPGQLLGHGIISLLLAIQNEMTGTLRMSFDAMNLLVAAPFMVPSSYASQFGSPEFRPGGMIEYTGNQLPQQLRVNETAPQIALEFQQYLYSRASRIAGAEGISSLLADKVRKAAEVNFTAGVVESKFGLVTRTFQRGMEEAAQVMLRTMYHNMADTGSIADSRGAHTVMPEDLDRRFRIIAQVSADNVNKQSRVQNDVMLTQLLRQSPVWQMRVAQGDLEGEHTLLVRMAEHMGETDPERLIGPVPQPMPPGAPGMMPTSLPGTVGGSNGAVPAQLGADTGE